MALIVDTDLLPSLFVSLPVLDGSVVWSSGGSHSMSGGLMIDSASAQHGISGLPSVHAITFLSFGVTTSCLSRSHLESLCISQALKPDKRYWYLVDFQWKQDKWKHKHISEALASIRVSDHTGEVKERQHLEVWEGQHSWEQ